MDPTDSTSFLSALHSDPDKIASLLEACRWNPDLSWEQLLRIAKYFEAVHASPGDAILHEGFHDTSLAVIAKGSVQIVKKDSHDAQKTLATVNAGRTLGEMSFVDCQPRSADCIATTDSVILVLSQDEFKKLIAECPTLACRILSRIAQTLSQRLRKTSGQLIDCIS
jgi:CRP/FNR family cyclic AMP-dependent transcriptional regulator